MCANHTPALTFDYCAAKPNEEGEHKMPEKFGRIPKKKQVGRLKSGRPAWELWKIIKTISLGQNRPSLNLYKRATKDGHRSRPAGRPHLSAIPWPPSRTHGLPPLLPIPSWCRSISFKILPTKIKYNTWMKWLGRPGIFSQPWYAKIYFLCKYRNAFGTHV